MTLWFIMIGTLGVMQIVKNTEVLTALNPIGLYIYFEYPSGFWILGAVFFILLVPRHFTPTRSLRQTQLFVLHGQSVLIALLLNYFGKGLSSPIALIKIVL
ncbi:MAG: KUP/HAK/KT family potassium transporter [Bacteroidetes bacterium]|nr:KUP/HAK/KT family potassium transporter [Bacteroidota bacterium]